MDRSPFLNTLHGAAVAALSADAGQETTGMPERSFDWDGVNSAQHGIVVLAMPPIVTPQPRQSAYVVPARSGTVYIPDSSYEEMEKALLERKGLDSSRWRLACYGRITDDIVIRIPVREQVILSDNSSSRLSGEEGLAAAVDLGSTTIVVQLIDRKTGAVLESFSEINGQNGFGADIISRIAYALQGPEYSERLALTVREQVGRMTGDAVKASGRDDIRNVTIVGNSVMHHLFCKLDVTPLSAYPFQSPDNGRKEFTPSELGWSLPETCTVHFMPNISHFVGSDILAGILHTGIHRKDRWCALLDLGTNGEIVIGNKERILCTSTPAGPAFEGVNIVNGMRAVSGAVCRVDETSGKAEIIGNTRPSGICGSGLIDAIHYFLKNDYPQKYP